MKLRPTLPVAPVTRMRMEDSESVTSKAPFHMMKPPLRPRDELWKRGPVARRVQGEQTIGLQHCVCSNDEVHPHVNLPPSGPLFLRLRKERGCGRRAWHESEKNPETTQKEERRRRTRSIWKTVVRPLLVFAICEICGFFLLLLLTR